MRKIFALVTAASLFAAAVPALAGDGDMIQTVDMLMFDFGEIPEDGWIQVTDRTKYTSELGYGFSMVSFVENTGSSGDGALSDAVRVDYTKTDKVSFNADVPPGIYEVSVYSGDIQYMTVALEGAPAIIDLRNSATEGRVEVAVTDGQLNISLLQGISGTELSISAVTIERKGSPEERRKRVFVCGDSMAAVYYPLFAADPSDESLRGGWGQLLENFLPDDIYVHDLSAAGETAKGFIEKGYLESVLAFSEPGDYVAVSFGYNDYLTYTAEEYSACMNKILDAVTEKGCIPIVCSEPAEFGEFAGDWEYTAADNRYEAEAKAAADAAGALYVDLHAVHAKYLEDIGQDAAESLFHITWSGARDTLHTNRKGAGQAARIFAEECLRNGIEEFGGRVTADDGISESAALKCRVEGDTVYLLNTSPRAVTMFMITNTYSENGMLIGSETETEELPAYDVFDPPQETALNLSTNDSTQRYFLIGGGTAITLPQRDV